MAGALDDDECVAREVLARDIPGRIPGALASADAETASLADRVSLESAVPANYLAVRCLDGPRLPRQPAAYEIAERTLADEADAGGVPLVGHRQAALAGDAPHLGLAEAADRELAEGELLGAERVQEVALVLAAVGGAQQAAAVDPRVMAGRVALRAEPLGILEADAEFDLTVAEHVRIGRATGLQLGEKMGEHALAVLRREARLVQRDAELVAHAPRVLEVGRGRAVTVVVFRPVRHEERLDAVAGVLEQRGRYRGVDAAGKCHDDAGHGLARDRAQREARDRHLLQHLERVARAAQVILDAELDERTPVLGCARSELPAIQPQRPDDRAVELRIRRALADAARERDAQHHPSGGTLPEIEAGQRLRHEFPAGLLAGLADHGLDERLARLEMTRRLVQHDAPRGALLHEQEASVLLGDGRDSQVELQ
jgi:hypothetical protein